jgi:hypothetical protein
MPYFISTGEKIYFERKSPKDKYITYQTIPFVHEANGNTAAWVNQLAEQRIYSTIAEPPVTLMSSSKLQPSSEIRSGILESKIISIPRSMF